MLLGLSNTAGVLAGVLGSLSTGMLVQQGAWAEVWGLSAAVCLVGTLVWNLFATGEKIID